MSYGLKSYGLIIVREVKFVSNKKSYGLKSYGLIIVSEVYFANNQ